MTDEKLALLEHITYIDEHVLAAAGFSEETILELPKNVSVEQILSKFDDEALENLRNYRHKTLFNIGDEKKQNIIDGAMVSGEDWANIIETLKTDDELKGLRVMDSEQIATKKGEHNLQICFKDPKTNQGIITYKGTVGYDEWDDNFKGLYEQDTPSQQNALDFFKRNEGEFDDIVLVGHSKGANKAMYVDIVADSDS